MVPALPLWRPPDNCQCETCWEVTLWLAPYRNSKETEEEGSSVASDCSNPAPAGLDTGDLTVWATAHSGRVSLPHPLCPPAGPSQLQDGARPWPMTQNPKPALHCSQRVCEESIQNTLLGQKKGALVLEGEGCLGIFFIEGQLRLKLDK